MPFSILTYRSALFTCLEVRCYNFILHIPFRTVVSDREILDVARDVNLTYADLQGLYMKLGIKQADIDNAERSIPVNDFKIQAVQVLNVWRVWKANAATRKALLTAMSECGLVKAKELLEDKWGIISHRMGKCTIR